MTITPDAIAFALFLFVMRLLNSAIGTVRLIVVTRDQRFLAAVLAFVEALVFAVVIANVVTDLGNLLNLTAYCGGFAVGGYLGMEIEKRFITSYVIANVIVQEKGHELAAALRERGYGVTETLGEGYGGKVSVLRSVVARREVPDLLKAINAIDPQAFVAMEEARAVHHGWLGHVRQR